MEEGGGELKEEQQEGEKEGTNERELGVGEKEGQEGVGRWRILHWRGGGGRRDVRRCSYD